MIAAAAAAAAAATTTAAAAAAAAAAATTTTTTAAAAAAKVVDDSESNCADDHGTSCWPASDQGKFERTVLGSRRERRRAVIIININIACRRLGINDGLICRNFG